MPDWDAFADARVDGYRRAQRRYVGSGASGKSDPHAIPAQHFTLSVMQVPPGQGNAAHSHEVEELGKAQPELMTDVDAGLQRERAAHLAP